MVNTKTINQRPSEASTVERLAACVNMGTYLVRISTVGGIVQCERLDTALNIFQEKNYLSDATTVPLYKK